jgi:hypothetical protein
VELVAGIEEAARGALEDLLRETGGVHPPTVHILAEDLEQPYVGWLTCRPFYRGADAAAAIAELGELPSVLAATRLVVTWEAQDLNIALEVPPDPENSALVVLDATLTAQVIHWYPLRLRPGTPGERAVVVAEWGVPVQLRGAPLPGPIAALLAVWRAWRDADLEETVLRLEWAGHRMRWAAR